MSDVQSCHAEITLVAVGNGVLNEVSPLDCHAAAKFTLFAAVPSCAPAGNDVRAFVPSHALVKFVPLLILSAGKEVSAEQFFHEMLKFRTLLVSIIGNEVSAVH